MKKEVSSKDSKKDNTRYIIKASLNKSQYINFVNEAKILTKGNASKLIKLKLYGKNSDQMLGFKSNNIDHSITEIDNEILDTYVKVRINTAQKNKLKAIADHATNGDLSKIIRLLCFNKKVEIISKVDIGAANQLRKIGVNINQIARVINAISNKGEYNIALGKLDICLLELKDTLLKIK